MPAVRHRRNYKSAPARRAPQTRAPQRRKTQSGWSMKLGAWAHARLREAQYDSLSRRVLQGVSLFVIAAIFLTIAAAVGLIDDAGRALSNTAATITRGAGLAVKNVEIVAMNNRTMTNVQKAEVEAIAGIIPQDIMFSVSPKTIRNRVMDLPWVESVVVRRLWPDHIQILVTPRAANALWQEGGKLSYIDASGKKLGPADATKVTGLPLVIGANAAAQAPKMFEALSTRRAIAARTYALERIGSRRWNIRLRTGSEILLPEQDVEIALDNLENLQARYRLLDRNFTRLDVRRPGFLLIRPSAEITVTAPQSV
ncbi:MAG: FtsQ-type POTRA domain-containing protein [Pseudomonadota bacterium]